MPGIRTIPGIPVVHPHAPMKGTGFSPYIPTAKKKTGFSP